MTEEPTPPSDDPQESKKMMRFGKTDARREPSDDFWDLDNAEDAAGNPASRSGEKLRESLPVPFAKGQAAPSSEEAHGAPAQREPRSVVKTQAFIQTNIPRDFIGAAKDAPVESGPRMVAGFGSLDGEGDEHDVGPARPSRKLIDVQEPHAAEDGVGWVEPAEVAPRTGTRELPAPNKPQAVTRGIIAGERDKDTDRNEAAEDDGKRKPLEPRLVAAPAEAEDTTEEFSERKAIASSEEEGQVVVREVGFGDLVAWVRNLSLLEKVCMVVMLLMAAGFAAVVFFPAMADLPDERQRARAHDFPLKGKQLQVFSAETYWREPVTEGADADVVRRGTMLIPVIEMKVAGDATVRVLFRNESGEAVGDPVTRTTSGQGTLKISGTAGFDQSGMHAAYRTSQSQPWSVQVYEAPARDTTAESFVPIFEMDLSAQLK